MGKTHENWVTHQNGQSAPLFSKRKKDVVRGRVLGLWKGGRHLTGRWKSKCLVNKWLLDCQKEWDSQ